MKTIMNHLAEIILAIAGVTLLVGVILCFATPIGNFFETTIDKLGEKFEAPFDENSGNPGEDIETPGSDELNVIANG